MNAAAAIDGHAYALENSIAYRLQHAGLEIDGEPFDLTDYPYAVEMLDQTHRRESIGKGAQLGITVMAIAKCVEKARTERLRSILYVFPSDRQVIEFSKARMGPFMANDLYAPYKTNVDSSGLRVINGTNLYFRAGGVRGTAGSQSLANVKSIPADGLIEDECDEIEQSRRAALEHRLDSSKNPWHISLSTPTLPGYGIALELEESDGRQWFWRCPKCNGWTCLEDHFPDCIATPTGGEAFYLCSKCREPLNRRTGQWVAARPERSKDWVGRYLSQLCSLRRDAQYVFDAWESAEKARRPGAVREFYNQVLGRPYAELDDQLNDALINAVIDGSRTRSASSPGPCAMGVDPGRHEMHWWVLDRITDVDTRALSYGRCAGFDEIRQIARRFNVACGVMDQGAETRMVREFVDSEPGWYGCQYVENRTTMADWRPADRLVRADRTQVLDMAHQAIVRSRTSLPASDETLENLVRPQLKSIARHSITDDKTGAVKHRWVYTGPMPKRDHLAHAHAYAQLGAERVGISTTVKHMRQAPRRRRSFMAS